MILMGASNFWMIGMIECRSGKLGWSVMECRSPVMCASFPREWQLTLGITKLIGKQLMWDRVTNIAIDDDNTSNMIQHQLLFYQLSYAAAQLIVLVIAS